MSTPNRTLCCVLDEMRKAYETRNFGYLPGLIEEIQSMGNRMEAALWDKENLEAARKRVSELNKQIKKLEKEVESYGGDPESSRTSRVSRLIT